MDLKIVPCEFRVVGGKDLPPFYQGKIHLLIESDTLTTYSFWRLAEAVDNQISLQENGIRSYYTSVWVPITNFSFPEKYKEILDYVCVPPVD